MIIFQHISTRWLTWDSSTTRTDKTRHGETRGTGRVEEVEMVYRLCMIKRDTRYIGQRKLKTELPGNKKRGRPHRTFVDAMKVTKK